MDVELIDAQTLNPCDRCTIKTDVSHSIKTRKNYYYYYYYYYHC